MESGDTIIDGGNTYYKDDIRRAKTLREKGIIYVDVGTSRRRVRARARLLHDDRRREGGGAAGSTRSSPRWRPGSATIERTPHRDGRDPRAEQGYIHAAPPAPGTS